MLAAPVDALIVAAGMDGALPSVVAGLVDVPVVGLPRSPACFRLARRGWRWSISTTASAPARWLG
jgi:hypothetical protein